MANVLKMTDQAAIIALWRRGWSQRRIARETGFDRSTVGRYVRLARTGQRPEAPEADRSKPAISTAGSELTRRPETGPATVAGRQSLCESVREIIEPKLEAGLNAQRIWQDLTSEHGFEGSVSAHQSHGQISGVGVGPSGWGAGV